MLGGIGFPRSRLIEALRIDDHIVLSIERFGDRGRREQELLRQCTSKFVTQDEPQCWEVSLTETEEHSPLHHPVLWWSRLRVSAVASCPFLAMLLQSWNSIHMYRRPLMVIFLKLYSLCNFGTDGAVRDENIIEPFSDITARAPARRYPCSIGHHRAALSGKPCDCRSGCIAKRRRLWKPRRVEVMPLCFGATLRGRGHLRDSSRRRELCSVRRGS